MIEGAQLAYLLTCTDDHGRSCSYSFPPDFEGGRSPREGLMKVGKYAKAITSAAAAGMAALGVTYVVPNAAVSDPPARMPGYRGGHGDLL